MLAVMVNCALMGMSDLADRLFPGYSTTQRLLGVVILEVSGDPGRRRAVDKVNAHAHSVSIVLVYIHCG